MNPYVQHIGTTLGLAATSMSWLSAQQRPNIIMFLVDDMGLMDTSVPFDVDADGNTVRHPLNDWYHTPGMERLARQGIRFSTFYAQSVSSPSRASLLTGQNAARHRTTNWIDAETNNRTEFGPAAWNWLGLTRTDSIYPMLLHQAGYRTIHVGKAHLGCNNSEGADPRNLGFDINIGGSAIGQPGSYYGENGYGWIQGNRLRAVPDLERYHGTSTFLTDALTLEAEREIKAAVDAEQPFYLNMAHYAVHQPFEPDSRFIDRYRNQAAVRPSSTPAVAGEPAQAYATLIEGMDKSLDDLLNYLDSLGVAQNTLIFFMGDNGGDAPLGKAADYGSAAPFRGKKGSEYEGGVRVPFIAAWAKPQPGHAMQRAYPIAQGAIQTQMATIMDLYPTILSVAGVPIPKGHVLDGSDLRRLMSGRRDRRHRDDFLMHFPHEHRGSYFTTYRRGDWKLIYHYNPERDGVPTYELYNLRTDPYERHDLAAKHPRRVKRLRKMMCRRLALEQALYPIGRDGRTLFPN